MTELEYEKVAKSGPAGSYAFGNTTFTEALIVTTPEVGNETVNAGANMHVRGTDAHIRDASSTSLGQGPLGVGIFARSGNGSRLQAGASFHGVMELSGNVWEPVVSAWPCGTVASNCAFPATYYTGIWGDGRLNGGHADVAGWPTVNQNNYGWRGGSWNDDALTARVSDRTGVTVTNYGTATDGCNSAAHSISNNLVSSIILTALPTTGGRGVR
jgi:hypothetical protein